MNWLPLVLSFLTGFGILLLLVRLAILNSCFWGRIKVVDPELWESLGKPRGVTLRTLPFGTAAQERQNFIKQKDCRKLSDKKLWNIRRARYRSTQMITWVAVIFGIAMALLHVK